VEERSSAMFKGTVPAFHFTGRTEENYENSSQSNPILAEIRTEHLQNSSRKSFRLNRFPSC
jgi:hypothetical protein